MTATSLGLTCPLCECDDQWQEIGYPIKRTVCGCRLCADCSGVDDDHDDNCPESPDYKPPRDYYEEACARGDALRDERKDEGR